MTIKTALLTIFLALLVPHSLAAQQGVIINEIMYEPTSPEPEWIELYNADSTAIDLTNWEIFTTSKSGIIPQVSIAAGGYLVFTKDSLELITLRPGNYSIAQMPLPDLDNSGSELILRNPSLQTIDSLEYVPSWGGSNGNSLERRNVLKSSTDPTNWGTCIAASGATPGARNSLAIPDSIVTLAPAHPLDVVMNEIMVEIVSPEPQWIELLNTTQDTIDIAGWTLTVKGHTPVVIPPLNTLIPADSMQILSSNDTALSHYRKIPVQRIVLISVPHMDYGGSTLALHDALGNLIDSAWYDGSWIKGYGISLERIDPAHIGYDSTNWGACIDSTGSTILRPNSIRIKNYDLALTNASVSDTSVTITITNVGIDTVTHTSLTLRIGAFDTIVQPLSIDLPSEHSLVVTFPLPQNFYGLFPAMVYIVDPLDENPTNDTLRCSVSPPIPQDSLVINEIMFDPQPDGCEWLELYNLSNEWISMDSTRLITGESRQGEYTHVIPPLVIAPDSFGIITANDSIYARYPALLGRNSIAQLGESSLDLGIDSCFVVLHNNASPTMLDSITIDSVHYFKSWQQSLLKKTFAGISLERKDPRAASNDPNNWRASLDTLGATPLATNSGDTSSTTTPAPSGTVFAASFSPNPFSPDGDGFEDVSVLTVETGNSTQWAMQVKLYDASGRLVRTLTNATTVLGSIALTFDGKRDNGQTLPPGLYTVLVELTSASPVQTLKQETGVVIAGKRK